MTRGDDVLCGEGVRYCRDGVYSGCEVISSYRVGSGPMNGLIDGPLSCGSCNPDCSVSRDYPTDVDLAAGTNDVNLTYNAPAGGVTITAVGSGTGGTVDTDGDGVPDEADECSGVGWRLPCDGNVTNDGFFHVLPLNGAAAVDPLPIQIQIRTADIFFLMDTTGSMGGELSRLKTDLTTGTFRPGCSDGIIGAIRCTIPDAWFGVGQFDDYPISPYGWGPSGDLVYTHRTDIASSIPAAQAAVNLLSIHNGNDGPESNSQAVWAVATGGGLGPHLAARTTCPAGTFGYPCFRNGTVPIVIMLTDAPFHNGTIPAYDYSALNARPTLPATATATAGNEAPATAYDIGTIGAGQWQSFTGNLCGMNDTRISSCRGWDSGGDAYFKFTLTTTRTITMTLEGTTGITYPVLTLLNSGGSTELACNGWSNSPIDIVQTLGPGTYYAVVDNYVVGCGAFKLTLGEAPPTPPASWPVSWSQVTGATHAAGVKVITVQSCGFWSDGYCLQGESDAQALANATDSLNSSGQPLVFRINQDGTGLTSAIVDAIVDLANYTALDITAAAVDNASTAAIDETGFVDSILPVSVTSGTCTPGIVGSAFIGCFPGAQVRFDAQFRNDFVMATAVTQVFDFDVVVYADGIYEIGRTPVRIVVPPTRATYTTGTFTETYDASARCTIPPQRPDWRNLSWVANTPSDTRVEFLIRTADTLADLATATPVTITVPSGVSPIDVGDALVAAGQFNFKPYLRVTARLVASTDMFDTPVLTGFELRYTCEDAE